MTDERYEGPDQQDADLFDDELDVIDCPHCGREIYAYSEKCPQCGTWLAMRHRNVKHINRPRIRHRWWGWIIALLILGFVLWLLFEGLSTP